MTPKRPPLLQRLISLIIGLTLVSACHVIEPAPDRPATQALASPASSPLSQIANRVQRNTTQSQSHFLLINSAHEALMWRLALIDSATSSIDIQTFLWANDHSGVLLYDRLIKAAKRGVRVRLLVDDIWLNATDEDLSSISQHPHFSIRLYNPSRVRNSKFGQAVYFLSNYRKMNRRMHNKTFIADGVMAIHGGRNIGDHYFGLDHTYNFRDLDVVSTGPVLSRIKHEFDVFWNSPEAYPAEDLAKSRSLEYITQGIRQLNHRVESQQKTTLASYPTQPQSWDKKLSSLPTQMTSGSARFISDSPDTTDTESRIMVGELGKMISTAKKEIIIVSPYFIPYQKSLHGFRKLTDQGVTIRLLVPSLGANNHTPAHSHYRKYRRKILESGVLLYEYNFQPSPQQRDLCDVFPVQAQWIGLHLKTIIVDRQHSYIGTLNLDPRAMNINTEEGLIIDSPQLGKKLASYIDEMLKPENSWQITLNAKNRMQWNGNEAQPLSRQPARGNMQRIIDTIARWLPIEKEL